MRFISGLKNLSRKTLLLIILVLFLISWFLFVIGFDLFSNIEFSRYFLYFLGILAGFTLILFIISFIKPIDKMGIVIIIIAAILTLPVMWLFSWIINFFYIFCFLANAAVTAFFAYKFGMDTSITVDDYLYKKKRSRIFTRIIEFLIFLFLCWLFISITIRFFREYPIIGGDNFARVFVNLFWVDLVLIIIVLLKLIFTKKLAAYITFFEVIIFFYVLYLVIDLWLEFILLDSAGYDILSFSIDLLLFIYVIGSIYDRVDYINEKLKIFRADTIALFVILMKLIVQITSIIQELYLPYIPAIILQQIIFQVLVLWFFFIIFTIIIGIYTIFKHKEGSS